MYVASIKWFELEHAIPQLASAVACFGGCNELSSYMEDTVASTASILGVCENGLALNESRSWFNNRRSLKPIFGKSWPAVVFHVAAVIATNIPRRSYTSF